MKTVDFLDRLQLHRRSLYHFTDLENLPLIREHGLLPYRELRARGIEPPKPGGSEGSRKADADRGLDGFVHLCLVDNHPMNFKAKERGHIGETRYLEISPEVVLWEGVRGTSIVSNATASKILSLEFALDEMELDLLFHTHPGEIFSDKKLTTRYNEARKAEILIPACIPPSMIKNPT